jgi:hypothetical protein
MRFLRIGLPLIWSIAGVTSDLAVAGPRVAYGARGSVFGAIDGVNGFPRTLQLMAKVAW